MKRWGTILVVIYIITMRNYLLAKTTLIDSKYQPIRV